VPLVIILVYIKSLLLENGGFPLRSYPPYITDYVLSKMLAKNFQIQVSQSILQFGFNQTEIPCQINEWLVLSLFTEGRISSGKAAQLLNISRIEFLALLRKRGVAFIDYTNEELEDEFCAIIRN
jgi:predicted HTH domain antitoxin